MTADIPFNLRLIAEGASGTDAMPAGAREMDNTYGENGYGGPAPPPGSGPHPYVATVYALNVEKLSLPKDVSLARFLREIDGKVIGEASVTGYFERK